MRIADSAILFDETYIESFKKELTKYSKIIGKEILYFKSLDSTNTLAIKLAEKGQKEGTVIIADEQLFGRGRFQRNWISPGGRNLYISVILKPELSFNKAPFLTMMTALSCVFTIRRLTPLNVSIKWPNDIVLNEKKLGGILIETRSDKGKVNQAILGIGINVNFKKTEMPEEIRTTATSMMEETGSIYSRSQLILELLKDLDIWCEILLNKDFEKIKKEWLNLTSTIGRFIRVKSGNNIYAAKAIGIDEEGMLLLNTGDSVKKISSGHVTVLK